MLLCYRYSRCQFQWCLWAFDFPLICRFDEAGSELTVADFFLCIFFWTFTFTSSPFTRRISSSFAASQNPKPDQRRHVSPHKAYQAFHARCGSPSPAWNCGSRADFSARMHIGDIWGLSGLACDSDARLQCEEPSAPL